MSDSATQSSTAPTQKGEVTTIEPTRAQRSIARRSAEARATIPTIELTSVVELTEPGGGTTASVVRACASALRSVPRANASYRDGRFELYGRVNIGVTIAEGELYVVPTIYDADAKSVGEIAEEIAALTDRAREGALTAPSLSGATFTMSRVSGAALRTLSPLVIPPQAAALAAGTVIDVPVIRDGAVVPGQTMALTLACDHRILYGALAADFMHEIKAHLEEAAR